MALSSSTLAALIKAKLLANPATGFRAGPGADPFCAAIAEAVIEHITAAAVVTTTFAPGTIQVAGSAAAQANPAPVVGTGSVT